MMEKILSLLILTLMGGGWILYFLKLKPRKLKQIHIKLMSGTCRLHIQWSDSKKQIMEL